MSPDIIAGPGWEKHVEKFANKMSAMEGVRMPGARRHKNRLDKGARKIDPTLLKTIRELG